LGEGRPEELGAKAESILQEIFGKPVLGAAELSSHFPSQGWEAAEGLVSEDSVSPNLVAGETLRLVRGPAGGGEQKEEDQQE
jgi:hypothetical protein